MNLPATPALSARILAMWTLAASTFLYAFLQRVSPSVMVEDLMRGFGVGGALLGNLSAFYLYAYAALQLPLGMLFDRFGVRRLMSASFVLAGLGSLLFAAADTLPLAYLGRLLIGAGVACSFVGALTVSAQWLPAARFGMFAGLVQLLGMVGAIFGQAPLAATVEALGWRGALAALGIAGIALALGLYAVLRDPPHAGGSRPQLGASLRAVIGLRDTWSCAVYGFAMTGPMLAFAGLWAVPFLATAYGLPRTTAAGLTSLIFVGWGVGAPTIGWLSDHLRNRKAPMLVCAVVAGLMLGAIILGPVWPLPLLAAMLVVHGACASAMVLSFALVKESNAPEASSAAMGVVNTFVVGSGALLQPFLGWLLDLQWNGATLNGARIYDPAAYRVALAVLPLLFVVALLAGLTMRERRTALRS
ncbi:MAG: MFS transporter [Alphaproteobacteria bacterium]|nr:MFS transporter [Alphaproteobacteria bacterium]